MGKLNTHYALVGMRLGVPEDRSEAISFLEEKIALCDHMPVIHSCTQKPSLAECGG